MSELRRLDPRSVPRHRAWSIYTRADGANKFVLYHQVAFAKPCPAGEVLRLFRHLTSEYDVMVAPEPQRRPDPSAHA